MSNDTELKRMIRNLLKALRYFGYIGFIGLFIYIFAIIGMLLGIF